MNNDKKIFDAIGSQMDVIMDSLANSQKGKPDCEICEGSGTMYMPNGEDDVEGETCDCISGLKEKLANALK